MLAEAGVVSIQPGIELFADNTLGLMHKGVSPLQNVQLLKWCREFGITPMWNLLYGFPRENLQDYGANLQTVQAITHLQSPMGYGPVRLERFSPMFEQPEAFGLRHIHPMKAYQYIYPFDEATLSELAYFFEFDFDGKEKAERWFIPIRQELERWKLAPAPATLQAVDQSPDHLIVHDTRPTRTQSEYQFRNPEKAVIEFCDEVRTFSKILEHVRNSAPDANKCSSAEWTAWLQGVLDYLVANRLMVRNKDRYLSVILLQGQQVKGSGVPPILMSSRPLFVEHCIDLRKENRRATEQEGRQIMTGYYNPYDPYGTLPGYAPYGSGYGPPYDPYGDQFNMAIADAYAASAYGGMDIGAQQAYVPAPEYVQPNQYVFRQPIQYIQRMPQQWTFDYPPQNLYRQPVQYIQRIPQQWSFDYPPQTSTASHRNG